MSDKAINAISSNRKYASTNMANAIARMNMHKADLQKILAGAIAGNDVTQSDVQKLRNKISEEEDYVSWVAENIAFLDGCLKRRNELRNQSICVQLSCLDL